MSLYSTEYKLQPVSFIPILKNFLLIFYGLTFKYEWIAENHQIFGVVSRYTRDQGKLGMLMHGYNPNTWGGRGRRIPNLMLDGDCMQVPI
jgi:hypothetical protein